MSFDFSVIISHWPGVWHGLLVTIGMCAVSLIASLTLGLMAALARISNKYFLHILATGYVEVFRDTPLLIQAFLIYYVLPFYGIRLGAINAGVLALSLYSASYFAEIIRGAILAVPKGQFDAARSVGMSYSLALRRVALPQITAYLIPPLTNQIITMIKNSSMLSIITVRELTLAGQRIIADTYSPIEAYTIVAVVYWILNAVVARVMVWVEIRTTSYRRPSAQSKVSTAAIGRE